MLIHPQFNPVALQLGPLAIHWYGLAYVVGLMLGLSVVKRLVSRHPLPNHTSDNSILIMDKAFIWIVLGVILGGRLGYILFYNLDRYLADPLAMLRVWEGGMAFHGGMLGVIVAMLALSWRYHLHPADLADRIVPVVPIGLFFGRIANFINGELWGKPVLNPESTPWAMVFPYVDALPRHPSQLYEAALEGLLLGAILLALTLPRKATIRRWLPSGIFLTGYGCCRIFVEIFREPEITHAVGSFFISQGQLLSLPMVVIGLIFIGYSYYGPQASQPHHRARG